MYLTTHLGWIYFSHWKRLEEAARQRECARAPQHPGLFTMGGQNSRGLQKRAACIISFRQHRGQFSLSICECMSGTIAHFMTCKVIACLSTGGQGVKPLVQCWTSGSPCASGSLWESLYVPRGPRSLAPFPGAECLPSPHRSLARPSYTLVQFACSKPSIVSDSDRASRIWLQKGASNSLHRRNSDLTTGDWMSLLADHQEWTSECQTLLTPCLVYPSQNLHQLPKSSCWHLGLSA